MTLEGHSTRFLGSAGPISRRLSWISGKTDERIDLYFYKLQRLHMHMYIYLYTTDSFALLKCF